VDNAPERLTLPLAGSTNEAPPMALEPAPIKGVVFGLLLCVIVGYAGWIYCLVTGKLESMSLPLLSVFAIHTVGILGLLLRYFGGSMKVTTTSAETGR
jgi:hypothetical protein